MEVKINVIQKINNGKVGDKRYDVSIIIPYGGGGIRWNKEAYLNDLDRETVKELITLLTQELENSLKI